MKINPKYTHFAVRKSDRKIVNGWEYSKELDRESITLYCKIDLNDQFPDQPYSNFSIYTKRFLTADGLNPFDKNNWAN